MSEIQKTVWLKNTTNKIIYEVLESELSIFQSDPIKVVLATESEVKKWKDGSYWDSVNDVEVTPVAKTPELEPAKK